MLVIAGPADASSQGKPATWVSVLKLLLGVLLVLLAARQWRGRPGPEKQSEEPKWMGSIERFSLGKAAGAGAVLSGANPKNLLLVIGAATAVAQTGIAGADQAVAYIVFAVIATSGVGFPVAMFLALGDRSRQILAAARDDGRRCPAAAGQVRPQQRRRRPRLRDHDAGRAAGAAVDRGRAAGAAGCRLAGW